MVTVSDLTLMDDPSGHIDRRLLDQTWFVRPSTTVPLRSPQHTFKRFNTNDGRVIVEGSDDHQLDNPRAFGKLYNLLISTHFPFHFPRS